MPSTTNQRIDLVLSSVAGFDEVLSGTATELSGVAVTGERTVEVTLSRPDPIFFQKIANHLAPVVKVAQARDENGEEVFEWWHPDNGVLVTGPFKPVSMDLDAGEIAFEPNENFFGEAPKLARIEVRSIEDAVTATALLQSGEMDAHTELLTPTLVEDLGIDFISGPIIPKGQHFWLNVSRAPTDDPKVRQALIMAIDRDGLMAVTFPDGPHEKADQVLNAVPGVDPAYEPVPFDPEAARQLLAESSYGGPEALPRIMIVGVSSPSSEAAAQYVAEQWRQNLGITAVEMKPQIDAYSGPDQASVQIFRDDVGSRVPDAVAYLTGVIHSGSGNAQNKLGGYADPEVDRLLDEGSVIPVDDPARDEAARAAQKIFRDAYAFIPWHYEAMSRWALPRVGGFDKNLDWQVVAPWAIEIGAA
jgi:peptide/nickel transport system substrate-binding protein